MWHGFGEQEGGARKQAAETSNVVVAVIAFIVAVYCLIGVAEILTS